MYDSGLKIGDSSLGVLGFRAVWLCKSDYDPPPESTYVAKKKDPSTGVIAYGLLALNPNRVTCWPFFG